MYCRFQKSPSRKGQPYYYMFQQIYLKIVHIFLSLQGHQGNSYTPSTYIASLCGFWIPINLISYLAICSLSWQAMILTIVQSDSLEYLLHIKFHFSPGGLTGQCLPHSCICLVTVFSSTMYKYSSFAMWISKLYPYELFCFTSYSGEQMILRNQNLDATEKK